jgi:hypothetical protein
MRVAGYLTDCSPSSSLNWASSCELFFKAVNLPYPRPYLSYLQVYGCRAYAHIPEAKRSQKEKLQECALIGYLVSYDSTNKLRIWIPSKSRDSLRVM